MPTRRVRVMLAEAGALLCHIALLIIVSWASVPRERPSNVRRIDELSAMPTGVVWLARGGEESHGGGGGGAHSPRPPSHVQLPGRDRESVPVVRPSETPSEQDLDPAPIVQGILLDARPTAAATSIVPGVLEPSLSPMSQGPGDGDGAGTRRGLGAGDGDGPGAGPGQNGGRGGGPYDPRHNGVSAPVALVIEKPRYTAKAMQAHIQGSVLVECVVDPNGVCRDVRVVRSLDQTFGLDLEAIKATEHWRFRPGTLLGQAVPVLVRIELQFAIR